MKLSSAVVGTAAAVFLATLATARADSPEITNRQLKKADRGAPRNGKNKGCADPAGVVVGVLDCLAAEDAGCAAAAYGPGYETIHNEEETVALDGKYSNRSRVGLRRENWCVPLRCMRGERARKHINASAANARVCMYVLLVSSPVSRASAYTSPAACSLSRGNHDYVVPTYI